MRAYDSDFSESLGPRPRGARHTDEVPAPTLRAAAAGRTDAIGTAGLLRLQRMAGNSGVSSLLAQRDVEESPVRDVISAGGGEPLDSATRSDMEARLGHDFGDVRVHTDARAARSAEAINAHAYAAGSNIVFQRDQYAPNTDAGRRTLAHELTHVVQQRSGPVAGTPTSGGISVSDPGDRFEREAAATADRVVSAPTPGTGAAVQRQAAAPEEEIPEADPATVQGAFVQRQENADEELPPEARA